MKPVFDCVSLVRETLVRGRCFLSHDGISGGQRQPVTASSIFFICYLGSPTQVISYYISHFMALDLAGCR